MAKKNEAKPKLNLMSRTGLTYQDKKETLQEVLLEGARLLEEEEKLKSSTKPLPTPPTPKPQVSPSNPYLRAKNEILSKRDDAYKKLIAKMENGELPKNRIYDDLVKEIVKLGDKLSD